MPILPVGPSSPWPMQMGEEGPIVDMLVTESLVTITADTVAALLNDARSGGYDVSTWTVGEIATDLICYAVDCENASVEQLTPFVQAWKDSLCPAGST